MATPETTESLPEEITRSLTAVWKRFTTKQPESASTEIEGNVVRCVMTVSPGDFALGAGEDGDQDPASRLVSYRRDVAKAVSRTTHCRVLAQMSDHSADPDVATEIFILEVEPKRPAFGEPGWVVS